MVLVVWKGKGWLVAAATFGCSLAAEILTRLITKDENYYQEHPWPLTAALLTASGILFFAVQRLKGPAPVATNVLDAVEKPPPNYYKFDHTLFWLPMEYWIFLLAGAALFTFFARS